MRQNKKTFALLASLTVFAAAAPAYAQISHTTWGQGGIRVGDSTTTCDAAAEGTIRYNDTTNLMQFCNAVTWADISSGGGGATLNGITAATANQAGIANAGYSVVWNWDALAGASAMKFASNATTAAGDAQTLFEIAMSGANATGTQTTYGQKITNTHTGTASTNVGLSVSASGGTNNYGLLVPSGNVGIGVTSPTAPLSIDSGSSNQIALFNSTGNPGMPYISVTGQFNTGGISFGATGVSATRVEGDGTNLTLFGSSSIGFHNGTTLLARVDTGGNVGIGTGSATPSYLLSLDGDTTARTIGMERETTNATAGRNLTVLAGGGDAGSTDIAGGDLVLSGGTSTGTGTSKIIFQGAGYGSTGTSDTAPAEVGRVTGGGFVQFKGTTLGSGDTMLAATGSAAMPNNMPTMLWYPRKAAFRAGADGLGAGTNWDDVNIGDYSVAFGYGPVASGAAAMAWGEGSAATATCASAGGGYNLAGGVCSTALGGQLNVATGYNSTALGGRDTFSTGQYSYVFGFEAKAGSGTAGDGAGDNSVAFGLGDPSAANSGEFPKVEGDRSFGIFMGDQKNVNVSANNVMALAGGSMIINPDTTSAADVTPDVALQVVGSIMMGDGGETCAGGIAGAIRYNGGAVQFCNGSAWANISSGGSTLNGITAATGNQLGISNGANLIGWNWQLTGPTSAAMVFGESAASTGGAGTQAILSPQTLAGSTAVPLWVLNAGNALSFRVEDVASDTSPFVIDNAGLVGIGVATPLAGIDSASSVTAAAAVAYGIRHQPTLVAAANNDVLYGMYLNNTYTDGAYTGVTHWDVAFDGTLARTIGMVRNTTAATAGMGLSINAGGAIAGTSNLAGGDLTLSGGMATGSGASNVIFKTAGGGGSGAADEAAAETMRLTSTGLGISNTSPAAKLHIGTAGSSLGTVRLAGNTSGYTQIQPAAAAGSWTMTLPPDDGTSGQVLSTDGNGVTTWETVGAGTTGIPLFGGVTDLVLTNGSFYQFSGPSVTAVTTATRAGQYMSTAGTLSKFCVTMARTNAAGGTATVSVYKNGAAAGSPGNVAVTLATNQAAGTTVCDNTNSLAFTTADLISVAVTGTTTTGRASGWTAQYDVAGGGGGGGSSTLNGITAATAANTPIDNTSYAQEWQWSTLAGANALKLSSTSTAAASNAQTLFNVALSGANGTSAQTTYGAQISNTHTGTTSTNVGLKVTASGGATANYGIDLTGALNVNGMAAPPVSASGKGTIYYDSTSNTFKASVNGGAYGALGGGVAGSDKQVQFNDGGSAGGGDADLTWNKTTNVLSVTGTVSAATKISLGQTAGAAAPTGISLTNMADAAISGPTNGQCLVYNGTDWANSSCGGATAVVSVSTQVIAASGTYTAPAGLLYAIVEVVGGGGGGGGGDAATTAGGCGGGGGGGGYSRELLSAATIGASQTVTVGALGSAGSTAGGNGAAGGDTCFGGSSSCGGTPLLRGNGGALGTGSGSNTDASGAGGAGGTAANGDVNIAGQAGSTCGRMATSRQVGSTGGDSQLGKGAPAVFQSSTTDATGNAGSSYGGGGGGGVDDDTTGSGGGAGTAGIIIVTEFKSQ